MLKSIYLAGVGGQGIQFLGKIIASAANKKDYYVTYSPKYGASKRGGLTSCYIVISDEPIGNPRRKKHDLVLAMEQSAYKQFRNNLVTGGTLVVNSTLVTDMMEPIENVKEISIGLHDIVKDIGNNKVISAVALGALAEHIKDVLTEDEILESLLETVPNKEGLIMLNECAFKAGISR
jgi:2-oxoglutarate ferredoxin oxidoreductase subunit gamma